MNRRSFNKALALLATTLGFKASKASAAAIEPLYREVIVGNYGFTSTSLVTSFDLDQVFEGGSLDMLADMPTESEIELSLSFYVDEDREMNRSVYFKGTQKRWEALPKKGEERMLPIDLVYNISGKGYSPLCEYYKVCEICIYDADTGERVLENQIQQGRQYTIHLDVELEDFTTSGESNPHRIILTDFKVVDSNVYNPQLPGIFYATKDYNNG